MLSLLKIHQPQGLILQVLILQTSYLDKKIWFGCFADVAQARPWTYGEK